MRGKRLDEGGRRRLGDATMLCGGCGWRRAICRLGPGDARWSRRLTH